MELWMQRRRGGGVPCTVYPREQRERLSVPLCLTANEGKLFRIQTENSGTDEQKVLSFSHLSLHGYNCLMWTASPVVCSGGKWRIASRCSSSSSSKQNCTQSVKSVTHSYCSIHFFGWMCSCYRPPFFFFQRQNVGVIISSYRRHTNNDRNRCQPGINRSIRLLHRPCTYCTVPSQWGSVILVKNRASGTFIIIYYYCVCRF